MSLYKLIAINTWIFPQICQQCNILILKPFWAGVTWQNQIEALCDDCVDKLKKKKMVGTSWGWLGWKLDFDYESAPRSGADS